MAATSNASWSVDRLDGGPRGSRRRKRGRAHAMVASWEGIEALERDHEAVLVAKHELDSHERDKLAPEAWYE